MDKLIKTKPVPEHLQYKDKRKILQFREELKEKGQLDAYCNARNVVEFSVFVASKSSIKSRVVFSGFLVVEVPPARHQEMEVLSQEEVAAKVSIIHLQWLHLRSPLSVTQHRYIKLLACIKYYYLQDAIIETYIYLSLYLSIHNVMHPKFQKITRFHINLPSPFIYFICKDFLLNSNSKGSHAIHVTLFFFFFFHTN